MLTKCVRVLRGIVLLMVLGLALPVSAADDTQEDMARVRKSLETIFPDMGNFDIVVTPMPGIYEVTVPGGERFYAHRDGIHFLNGDLYQARGNGFINLTEQKLDSIRRKAVREIAAKDKITFAADNEKARIAIFTDVSCTYCRKIHKEVPALNALGITVDYLAFPRGGPQSRAYRDMISAWCADDRQDALTRLKQSKKVEDRQCKDNPVMEQYELGGRLGVRGTPAIVLENGRLLPGYVPADKLAKQAIQASGR